MKLHFVDCTKCRRSKTCKPSRAPMLLPPLTVKQESTGHAPQIALSQRSARLGAMSRITVRRVRVCLPLPSSKTLPHRGCAQPDGVM